MDSRTAPDDAPATETSTLSLETLAIHADDHLNKNTDVAPAMHVSTTFRYSNDPEELRPIADEELEITDSTPPVYSRLSAPNTTRLESLLSRLTSSYALTYSSGLSAFHALLVYYNPRVIAISGGYHGCHGVISLVSKLSGLKVVDLFDEEAWDAAGLGEGDIVHVETPLNPTGEARDLVTFKERAKRRKALLTVDATFGPPGLQDPFKQGADVVMHSGTKYIGGHSDMLCGVLCTRDREVWQGLWTERLFLGSVMGSFEGWLGVRSLRTLEMRVRTQSRNAERLVEWLDGAMKKEGSVVKDMVVELKHASLQAKGEDGVWLKKQMPNGYGPVFAMTMKDRETARRLPSKLHLFHHATSLGGVESLIEWRRMSDQTVDDRLMRVSVGAENWEDLKEDLENAFEALKAEGR
ncbi:cystathionine gamma-synthase [Aulographum hederae CBS 113979]|uniref:Cystathionine gamma-synthase n=1 Tax=Aulographum hederae CBS 113979 TaxID=1176131 RepID=A0A6G1HB60_9PEZI|nr:cystathionine gamma-synthase [Aulographum hederae CBS 113979]